MIKFQSFLSSSSGNATFVTDGSVSFLVDCGANGKYITECLRRIGVSPLQLSGILVTHEHRDHIAGIGVMSRKFDLPVYATEKTWAGIGDSIGVIRGENRRLTRPEMQFDSLRVTTCPIPHDAKEPISYRFYDDDNSFAIATDIGCITKELEEHLSGSETVLIEANHDEAMLKNGRYPFYLQKRILSESGHLSNENCGSLCVKLVKKGTKALWLGHLSLENNTPELAYHTVLKALQEASLFLGSDVSLNVLPKCWIERGKLDAS